MFRYVRKVFFAWVILITFSAFTAYADVEESFAELSESLAEVTKDFNELAASNLEEAAVIDNSIKEINKAVEFVQQNIETGDPDIALKAVDSIYDQVDLVRIYLNKTMYVWLEGK